MGDFMEIWLTVFEEDGSGEYKSDLVLFDGKIDLNDPLLQRLCAADGEWAQVRIKLTLPVNKKLAHGLGELKFGKYPREQ